MISRIFNSKMVRSFIFFMLFLMIIEVIFMALSDIDIFKISTIRVLISVISYSLFLSLIMSFVGKRMRFFLSCLILLAASFYAVFQLGFINYIGVYASFNNVSQLSAVESFTSDFVLSINEIYYTLFIPFIAGIVFYKLFLYRDELTIREIKINKYLKESIIKIVGTTVVLVIVNFCFYKTLVEDAFISKYEVSNLVDLYNYPDESNSAVNNFGILTYGVRDFRTKFFEVSKTVTVEVLDDSAFYDEEREEYWNELIALEEDETYSLIHNYLKNNSSNSNNDYTGIFEDKNVIFVFMESINEAILMDEYYPNFSTLMDNGIYFENNYAPRNNCSTGNNEFATLTSLYVMTNNCTVNEYVDNVYPYSLFNLFSNDGYTTTSMHNYNDTFYERHTSMPNLGADEYFGIEELEIPYENNYIDWVSDFEFGEKAMELTDFDSDEPFMLWLTTVTAHSPYDESSEYGDLYFDLFEDTDYSDDVKRYLSKVKVTDDMLGVLLETLEDEGILEDTVIVALADHYPYGLSDEDIKMLTNNEKTANEVDKVPFIIYNASISSEIVSDYTTYLNVLPTVANLFDLDYKSEYYFGTDALDDKYTSMSVFTDGSWKNEHAFYDAVTSKITYYGDFEYSVEEVKNINLNISNDKKISSLIIEYDYFNYLKGKEEE